MALLRSRSYLQLLAVAALLGVPVSAAAYGFLALVAYLQEEIFTHLPHGLGFAAEPSWWPVPVLAAGGVLAGLAIRYLPGRGGPSPADDFKLHPPPQPRQLAGVVLAALATLCFGAVLGPEMPLIAVGGGLAVLAVRLARQPVPKQAASVLAATGSFAAVSTLLGSPLLGAFLLMEASGLGGPTLGLVLVPGLLASGIGSLIFIGLDSLTGLGTFSLAIPGLPHFARPDVAEFGWAIVIGLAAALLGRGIRWLGSSLKPYADRSPLLTVPLAGIAVGVACFRVRAVDRQADLRRAVLRARTSSARSSPTPPATAREPSCSCWPARDWPTGYRWAASAADRYSPACSWARPAAPRYPTCRGCRWCPRSRWASARCR